MSIITEPLADDWKIDPRDDGRYILRVCVNGRWKHGAEIERDDNEWIWESNESVCRLGECSEKDAVDYLWNNRGRQYPDYGSESETHQC